MNLRQALTFVTVAELGTVSKAALQLRIAQPALSRQIIDLERELGLRLFDRVGRRLLLTGEGEQMIAGQRRPGAGSIAPSRRQGRPEGRRVAATH
jgi:DNA-binding transcriptional LysR family regulator